MNPNKFPAEFDKLVDAVRPGRCSVDHARAYVALAISEQKDRDQQILAFRWGFYDGHIWPLRKVGEKLSVTGSRIHELQRKTQRRITRRVLGLWLRSLYESEKTNGSIDILFLSTRAREIAEQTGITIILDLYEKSLDFPWIRNGGQKFTEEINIKLHSIGLPPLPSREDIG